MKQLIRKELLEVMLFVGLQFLALCVVWIGSSSFQDVLLAPQQGPLLGVVGVALASGVLIAFFQFTRERGRGTAGYLLHRGTGHGGAFAAKVLAGLAGSALMTMGPPVLFALRFTLTDHAPIIQWTRLLELAVVATIGASAYAAAVLATQLRRGILVDAAFAVFACGGITLVSMGIAVGLPGSQAAVMGCYLAVQGILSVALLLLGRRMFGDPLDRDLPLATVRHGALLGVVAFLLLPFAWILVDGLTTFFRSQLLESYPALVQDRASGDLLAVARGPSNRFGRLTAEGTVVEDERLADYQGVNWHGENLDVLYQPEDLPHARALDVSRLPSGPRRLRHSNSWTRVGILTSWTWLWSSSSAGGNHLGSSGGFEVRAYLDLEEGALRVFALPAPAWPGTVPLERAKQPPSVPFELTIHKPSGSGRFSPRTGILLVSGGRLRDYFDIGNRTLSSCIIDPEDSSIWRLDLPDFSTPIKAATLPEGDRFVGTETAISQGDIPGGRGRYKVTEELVRGERGLYRWTGTVLRLFDATSEEDAALTLEAPDLSRLRVVVLDSDPLAMSVEVRDAKEDRILISHHYGPKTGKERALHGLVLAGSLVMPPIENLLGFLSDGSETLSGPRRAAEFPNPIFAGRSRPVWIAASLVLGVFLGARMIKRLRRRGAATGIVAITGILVSLFGVPAYLLLDWLEPRRTTVPDTEPREAVRTELLIQSA